MINQQYIIRINGLLYFTEWRFSGGPQSSPDESKAKRMPQSEAMVMLHRINALGVYRATLEPVKESNGK